MGVMREDDGNGGRCGVMRRGVVKRLWEIVADRGCGKIG